MQVNAQKLMDAAVKLRDSGFTGDLYREAVRVATGNSQFEFATTEDRHRVKTLLYAVMYTPTGRVAGANPYFAAPYRALDPVLRKRKEAAVDVDFSELETRVLASMGKSDRK